MRRASAVTKPIFGLARSRVTFHSHDTVTITVYFILHSTSISRDTALLYLKYSRYTVGCVSPPIY